MIRQVPLEQPHVPVDRLDQTDAAGQEMDGPGSRRSRSAQTRSGDLVADVAARASMGRG